MKRKAFVLGLLLILITLPTSQAFAAGKLVSSEDSLRIIPYYTDGFYGAVCAELSNTGDKPVQFSSGLVELFDPDGNSITSADVYGCYPPVLQPGENAYLYSSSYVATTDKSYISDYMLTVTGKGSISQKITRLTSAARYDQVTGDYAAYHYLVSEAKNDTENVLTAFEIVFVMRDAEGKLLYVANSAWSGYNVGIMPGSSLELRIDMGWDLVTYLTDNNIVAPTVESIAYATANI